MIDDAFEGYDADLFSIPNHYKSCVDKVLIPNGLIQVSIIWGNISKYSRILDPVIMKIINLFIVDNLQNVSSILKQLFPDSVNWPIRVYFVNTKCKWQSIILALSTF